MRLADHPALAAAAATGAPLFCFHVVDGESAGVRPLGGASKWWVGHSLASLTADLKRIGGDLHLFHGPARAVVARLTRDLAPASAFWNRRYVAAEIAVDEAVSRDLAQAGVRVKTFNGALCYEPADIAPKAGGFYRIYAPWWRAAQARPLPRAPLPAPVRPRFAEIEAAIGGRSTLAVGDPLPNRPDWTGGLRAAWVPGERPAREALAAFVGDRLGRYAEARNVPALTGSSRLSPHLRFGEVSPFQVVDAVRKASDKAQAGEHDRKFLQEVAWRDFCTGLLFHLPELPSRPFNPRFGSFPYRVLPAEHLTAWRRGRTGYPIVDAGMRQLWQTGAMHNRVRMITASFLVKHLLADWRLGEAWFWDTLCDADAANNAVNWQWVAGCGPDAAPFFRIFNPVLQGEKFDTEGTYVRKFVPELSRLAPPWIHKPWEAPPSALAEAGVNLGSDYPWPIVDHASARARALAALASSRVAA